MTDGPARQNTPIAAAADLHRKRRRSIREKLQDKGSADTHIRLQIWLPSADAQGLVAEADQAGLTVNAWVVALIRRRLRGKPTLLPPDAAALPDILRALRHIANSTRELGRPNACSLDHTFHVEQVRLDVRRQMERLRVALAGNLAYWDCEQ